MFGRMRQFWTSVAGLVIRLRNLILRSGRSPRLEGWATISFAAPSFETPAFGGLLRMNSCMVASADYAPPARIISTIFIGDSGTWPMRTRNGVSASSTAEISAAAAGIVPASPTPLTPSGLSGERVSL